MPQRRMGPRLAPCCCSHGTSRSTHTVSVASGSLSLAGGTTQRQKAHVLHPGSCSPPSLGRRLPIVPRLADTNLPLSVSIAILHSPHQPSRCRHSVRPGDDSGERLRDVVLLASAACVHNAVACQLLHRVCLERVQWCRPQLQLQPCQDRSVSRHDHTDTGAVMAHHIALKPSARAGLASLTKAAEHLPYSGAEEAV